MTEPPPTARKASGLKGLAHSTASRILRSGQLAAAREEDERDARAVLGLHPRLVEDPEVDAFSGQCLSGLLHGRQLVDRLVRHDADALGAHVPEVHADLTSDAGAEADGGGGQLEGVFLELGVVLWRGIPTHGMVWPVVVVMVARVGMAWTRGRMSELDRPQQVHCPGRSLRLLPSARRAVWGETRGSTYTRNYTNSRRHDGKWWFSCISQKQQQKNP